MHPESLLRVPLVRRMVEDDAVAKAPRAIDKTWRYEGVVPISIGGFNPFAGSVYYGARSAFADWLRAPHESARPLNENDRLVQEVLFAVHDYLHVWGYRLIQQLRPDLGFGTAPITRDNLETFAFLHLVTEAVATVGLDYWYLCTIDLNAVAPIGSRIDKLTVDYRDEDLDEFRRFNPALEVQSRQFFTELATAYCSGIVEGFDVTDVKHSPKTLAWLRHELGYGVTQRVYTRRWLAYLSHERMSLAAPALEAPVVASEPWQVRLVAQVAERLWQLVKHDRDDGTTAYVPDGAPWTSSDSLPIDFRFANLNRLSPDRAADIANSPEGAEIFQYLFWQYASAFDHESFDTDLIALFPHLLERRDMELARRLFKTQPRIPACAAEPVDLLFLN